MGVSKNITLDSFIDDLWTELPPPYHSFEDLACAVNNFFKENNLMITSRPITQQCINRSIDPVKFPVVAPKVAEQVYRVSYKSLELDKLQIVFFKEESWMLAFLTGIGANKKMYDLNIAKVVQ